jgi:pyridinium-3,5-bisthiocarboxylic acid mononucleotide nickel chelatase
VTTLAYIDCVSGVAGDMLLGALLGAGAPEQALSEVPEQLGLRGVQISVAEVERQGAGAIGVSVSSPERQAHRAWTDVKRILERSALEPAVRDESLAIFTALAHAEAAVHGVPVERVHFHEVGAVDALVDVCGSATLLHALRVDRVVASPLPLARGLTTGAHGVLPLPAPATLRLLEGAAIYGVDGDHELVTPTGAAIVMTVAESMGPIPAMRLCASGAGAGDAKLAERPNIVRVLIGAAEDQRPTSSAVLIETNLDDMLPELVPDAIERCFAAGALDVWIVPAQMKKNRPGVVFSALARPARAQAVIRAILSETTALGCRVAQVERAELEREEYRLNVDGGEVRVKVGRLGRAVVNVAPEHDDCAALARAKSRPVKAVWAEAMAAATRDGLV